MVVADMGEVMEEVEEDKAREDLIKRRKPSNAITIKIPVTKKPFIGRSKKMRTIKLTLQTTRMLKVNSLWPYFVKKEKANNVWFLDSGCSNHMAGTKSLFKKLDESQKLDVTLGDNKHIQVKGKGTVSIKTSQGIAKIVHDVMHVPSLSHNQLSVGQLLNSGYSTLFDDNCCTIRDKKSGQIIATVPM